MISILKGQNKFKRFNGNGQYIFQSEKQSDFIFILFWYEQFLQGSGLNLNIESSRFVIVG